MEEHDRANEGYDLVCNAVTLPCSARDVAVLCKRALQTLQLSEEVVESLVDLMKTQNQQSAREEFMQLMKVQLQLWRQHFSNSRSIRDCLKDLSKESLKMFGFDRIFSSISPDFFTEQAAPNKLTQIVNFITNLAQAFLVAGDYYMQRYDLSKEWQHKHAQTYDPIKELLIECYRKFCYFYHPDIAEEIRKRIDDLPSISVMLTNFRSKSAKQASIHDTATMIIARQEAKTRNTINFQKAYEKVDENIFTNRCKIFKQLYQQYHDTNNYLGHLLPSQKRTLAYILVDTLEKMPFCPGQKEEINQLIHQKGLGLEFQRSFVQEESLTWLEADVQKTLVKLFVAFSAQTYNSTLRQYLRFVYRRLADLRYRYSNFRVLVLLENRRHRPSSLLDLLRSTKAVVNEPIKLMLTQIKKKYGLPDKVPYLTLQQIGNRFSPHRVITIFISGFTCQEASRQENWKALLHNGETYAMNWQCKSKSLATLFFGFNSVRETAIATGKYLACLIKEQMKGYLVNLVGFSLGTELALTVVQNMGDDIGMINKIVFLSGVAGVVDIMASQEKFAIETVNCYNPTDTVLRIFLPLYNRKLIPCGLNQIFAPFVTNVNVEKFVNVTGHQIAHMELRKLVQFENDMLYTEQQGNN